FANVMNAGLNSLDVARCLRSAPVQRTTAAERYLLNRDADALVITDVVESDTVRVLPLELGDQPVRLDIRRLQSMVGGAWSISGEQDWVECRGATPATIAFKCFRLERAPPCRPRP